jgi:hypothetical protein
LIENSYFLPYVITPGDLRYNLSHAAGNTTGCCTVMPAHSLDVEPWQPLTVTAFVGKGKAFMSQKSISSLYASFSLIFTVASLVCSPSIKKEGKN